MSAQVAHTPLYTPFASVAKGSHSVNGIRNKKRKTDYIDHPSPKKFSRIENCNTNTSEKINRVGKPVGAIAPLLQSKTPNIPEDDFLTFNYSIHKAHSDYDSCGSLLRSKLLSKEEQVQVKSEFNMEKSTGQKFLNPKKEFIVKHNKDTTDLKNNDLKYNAIQNQHQHQPNLANISTSSSDYDTYATSSSSRNIPSPNEYKHVIYDEFKANSIKMEEPQSSEKVMSNMEFWKYLLTLQVLMQQASVQLKNMVTKPVEELVSHSLKLVELKNELEPHLGLLENSLHTILNVLPHVEYVEIGSPENTFKVSQQAWEKAYSKTTIKDSALAFLECDLFIPKQTKLSSTAGRSSNSAINGTLKPIDSRILNALYYTLADRKRMPNIQRTQDNYLASPHFLTAKEQKLVRETLAQYFNQLRQKEKRRSHLTHNIKKEDESY